MSPSTANPRKRQMTGNFGSSTNTRFNHASLTNGMIIATRLHMEVRRHLAASSHPRCFV